MPECERLPKCLFFNEVPAFQQDAASRMKLEYCLGNNACCARLLVMRALGPNAVPEDLSPAQLDRARAILAAVDAAVPPDSCGCGPCAEAGTHGDGSAGPDAGTRG